MILKSAKSPVFYFSIIFAKVSRYIFGKSFTFINPTNLKGINGLDGIYVLLNPNASFNLLVHDPKYFIMTGRQMVFPGIFRLYQSHVRIIKYHNEIIHEIITYYYCNFRI